MLSTKQAKWALHILVPLFIAVLSIFILAAKVPETHFVQGSVESLEKSEATVMRFTGATVGTSLALSALPDDFASPLANTLSDMSKYFVIILTAIFLERLIVIEGIKISFLFVLPIACGLYILGALIRKKFLKGFAYKLAVLGLALVLVIPCSTHFTDVAGARYLAYVDETISETNAGADKINGVMADGAGDGTIFEKLSQAFKTAIQGIQDLLTYFNNVIKKCINSIAIMIVTNVVMPVLTLLFFKWLLKELFKISLPPVSFPMLRKNKVGEAEKAAEIEEEEQ